MSPDRPRSLPASRPARAVLLVALVLAVGCLAGRLLAQDAADSYQAGLDAFARKDFGAAAEAFRQAIRREPSEQRRLHISGTFFHEYYVPHFFLGLALKELGDGPGARAELLLSRGQGLVSQHPTYGPRLAAAVSELDARAISAAPPPANPFAIPAGAGAGTAAVAATPRPGAAAPPGSASGPPAAAAARTASPAGGEPGSETRIVLRNGVRSFFRGDYEDSVKTLSGLSDAGNETARLFIAFALAGGALAGGREAGPDLPRARALFESLPPRARPRKPPGVSSRILEALGASSDRPLGERSQDKRSP